MFKLRASCFLLITKIKGKLHYITNAFLVRRPALVSILGLRYTVLDAFGSPGDTILCATVCRNLRQKNPNLRINCITKNSDLLIYDPNISELNKPQGLVVLKFWYLDIILNKDGSTHLLDTAMALAGFRNYDRSARFYLSRDEINWAISFMSKRPQPPYISFNIQSREQLKVWSIERWRELLSMLTLSFPSITFVQLGLNDEPFFDDVVRLAGNLTMRESVAVQSLSLIHIGCVSFLMHTANGVGIPSLIIYGGRETPDNSGYLNNENVSSKPNCSPCWLHDSYGDICAHDKLCMANISVSDVFHRATKLLSSFHFFPIDG